jgi:hypothetical protein
VSTAAEQQSTTRAQELWDDELARLLAAAASLDDRARAAVRTVLCSLAADPTADAVSLRDVEALLAALDRPPGLGQATPAAAPALPGEPAHLASAAA